MNHNQLPQPMTPEAEHDALMARVSDFMADPAHAHAAGADIAAGTGLSADQRMAMGGWEAIQHQATEWKARQEQNAAEDAAYGMNEMFDAHTAAEQEEGARSLEAEKRQAELEAHQENDHRDFVAHAQEQVRLAQEREEAENIRLAAEEGRMAMEELRNVRRAEAAGVKAEANARAEAQLAEMQAYRDRKAAGTAAVEQTEKEVFAEQVAPRAEEIAAATSFRDRLNNGGELGLKRNPKLAAKLEAEARRKAEQQARREHIAEVHADPAKRQEIRDKAIERVEADGGSAGHLKPNHAQVTRNEAAEARQASWVEQLKEARRQDLLTAAGKSEKKTDQPANDDDTPPIPAQRSGEVSLDTPVASEDGQAFLRDLSTALRARANGAGGAREQASDDQADHAVAVGDGQTSAEVAIPAPRGTGRGVGRWGKGLVRAFRRNRTVSPEQAAADRALADEIFEPRPEDITTSGEATADNRSNNERRSRRRGRILGAAAVATALGLLGGAAGNHDGEIVRRAEASTTTPTEQLGGHPIIESGATTVTVEAEGENESNIVKHKLGEGDTIWYHAQRVLYKKEGASKLEELTKEELEKKVYDEADKILKRNGLSWNEAKFLPVGFEFDVEEPKVPTPVKKKFGRGYKSELR